MSNGIIAAGCCCETCIDCCKFWEDAPNTINVAMTFYQVNNFTIIEGSQSYDTNIISWSITATLTKSGSCCDYPNCAGVVPPRYPNLLRYTADVCQVSVQHIKRYWSFGRTWANCLEYKPPYCYGFPPGICNCIENPIGLCPQFIGGTQYGPLDQCNGSPCTDLNLGLPPNEGYWFALRENNPCEQWNCSGGDDCKRKANPGECNCGCPSVGELEWKNMLSVEVNYSATVSGAAPSVSCDPLPGDGPILSTCGACPHYPDCANCGTIGGNTLIPPAVTGKVLTLWCGVSNCGGECNVPVLVFNPGDQEDILHSVTYEEPVCCGSWCPNEHPGAGVIPNGECFATLTYETPLCLPKFQIQGAPGHLSSASFDKAISNCDIDVSLNTARHNYMVDGRWVTCCEPVGPGLTAAFCYENYQDNSDPSSGYYCANTRFVDCDSLLETTICQKPSWTERYCYTRQFGVLIS